MQRAVASLIASLRPQDRVAIGSFDDQIQVHLRWTSDRAKALSAIPDLIRPKAVGGTSFYRALERTLRREMRIDGRKALFVLTDGRDTTLYRELVSRNRLVQVSNDRGYQRALRAAKESHIPVYFIALNTDRNFEPNPDGGDEFRNLQKIFPNSPAPNQFLAQVRERMEQVSEVSGGSMLYPDAIEDITHLYEQIGRALGSAYSLGYTPTDSTRNGSFRRIDVRTNAANVRVMQSRNGYYAR
jgi:VWFA-related protein